MQQMYTCPNCGVPVAYGQPYCTNCNMTFTWQALPPQDQYGSSYQYNDQQQWYQASQENQGAGAEYQDENKPPKKNPLEIFSRLTTGLGQFILGIITLVKNHKAGVTKVSVVTVVIAGLIVAGVIFRDAIARLFAAPSIVTFTAGTPGITEGDEITLQWDVTGTNTVSITPEVGPALPRGKKAVAPGETTTYTLIASNMFGTVRKSITVTVSGRLPTISSFSSDTENILAGQMAIISWNVSNASSVSISPEVGAVSPSGTKNVSPAMTTNYVLTASNSAGNTTASVTVNVTSSKSPIITSFNISPTNIISGDVTTLSWDVIGAKSININQGIGGVASKGSMKVSPPETASYTLTAGNDYAAVTKSVTVTVDTSSASGSSAATVTPTPPYIDSFSANRNTVLLGDNVTLNWNVARARTVTISPDVGSVPSSGWTMVIPITTTIYKITAVNTFGTSALEVTVNVNTSLEGQVPVIRSFSAMPNTINKGGAASLQWDIKGATLLLIDHGIGVPGSKYSQQVSPAETTTYTLTAINSRGIATATTTVTVVQ